MNAMSVGASSLAHDVHYTVLGVGLVGLLYLLVPQWAGGQPHAPRDDHERRVAELRHELAPAAPRARPAAPTLNAALLPIAVVSSTAAAGVHAAAGPAHFGELLLFGLFFAGSATAQLVWSVWMALAPTRRLLLAGVIGNAGIVVLWLVTRTAGLPFGLLPHPEAVGLWDVCCGAWEVVVVITGALLLRGRPVTLHLPTFVVWPRSARLWMVASSIVLGALTVSGAGG